MITPNIPCKLYPLAGYDAYGAAKYDAAKPAKCLMVKFETKANREMVRVDAGASRGNGKERTADVVLLFKPDTGIAEGDKLEIMNETLQVTGTFPRFDLGGKHDHDQVELMIWQSE